MPRPSGAARLALEQRRAERRKKTWLSLALLIGGLGVIAAVGVVFAPKSPDASTAPGTPRATVAEPSQPPAPRDADELGIVDRTSVAPIDLLGRAKARALAWDREATLVSITASPVVSGKVDLTAGGRIEFVFGKPTGGGFGPGTAVKPSVLSIVADAESTSARETPGRSARAATEPNCTPAEVAKALGAAGVTEAAPLELLYAFSQRHDRAAWRARVRGERGTPRYVDGWTCTILVR